MEKNENIYFHKRLAEYLVTKPLYLDENIQKKPNIRKLVEQPWQQTNAELWDELKNTVCILSFIEAKCAFGMTYGLLHDFQFAEYIVISKKLGNEIIGGSIWNQWKDFLIRESENFLHFAKTYQQIIFQQAYNTLYHPEISKAAKEIKDKGLAPDKPWFRIYELEPNSLPYKPPVVFRKPIDDERKTGYQDLTTLEVINSNRMVSGYLDGYIAIWDVNTGIRIHFLKAHSWQIHSILSIDKNTFATGGDDGIIKIWDVNTGLIVYEFKGHTSKILCLKKWKNQYIVSGSSDKSIRVWSLSNYNEPSIVFLGHEGVVIDLVFFKQKYLISISSDNTFGFWDIEKKRLIRKSSQYTQAGNHSIILSHDFKMYSFGVSGILYWGNVKDIFNQTLFKTIFGRLKSIFPLKKIDTPEMHCDYCILLSDNELITLDLGRIAKINLLDNSSILIIESLESFGDHHRGIFRINDEILISINEYGSVWRWDLPELKRTKIAKIAIGIPHLVKMLDEKRIIIGTQLSEMIFIVDLFPASYEIKDNNCILIKDMNLNEYPTINYFKNELNMLGQKLTEIEVYELLRKRLLGDGFELSNSPREDWQKNGSKLSGSAWIDVRNNFLYYMDNEKQLAVLPGVFTSCYNIGNRIEVKDIDGRNIWIELMNVNKSL